MPNTTLPVYCNDCPARLQEECLRRGSGNTNPNIIFLSESPTKEAVLRGSAFAGLENALLSNILKSVNKLYRGPGDVRPHYTYAVRAPVKKAPKLLLDHCKHLLPIPGQRHRRVRVGSLERPGIPEQHQDHVAPGYGAQSADPGQGVRHRAHTLLPAPALPAGSYRRHGRRPQRRV